MRATISWCSSLLIVAAACARPRSEPARPREAAPPAPSAQTAPSTTATTSGSPGPPPPAAPNLAPPKAVAAKSAGPPREGCDGLFDPPAGAVKLCDGRVFDDDGDEVRWTLWAVKSSRTETFRRYREHAGACGARSVSDASRLTVRKDEMALSVHLANTNSYPSCGTPAAPDYPTVVFISEKVER